jgi:hypothetical protein
MAACAAILLALMLVFGSAMLLKLDVATVGRCGSNEPCVCECFLLCPRWKSLELCFSGEGRVTGDALLNGRSERVWTVVGREKLVRLLELELACGWAYRGRGGGGGVGAFCREIPRPAAAVVEGRGLLMVRGVWLLSSSSSEEDSTLRRPGRELVDCAVVTIGEKLPGALDCGVPVGCDMAAAGL